MSEAKRIRAARILGLVSACILAVLAIGLVVVGFFYLAVDGLLLALLPLVVVPVLMVPVVLIAVAGLAAVSYSGVRPLLARTLFLAAASLGALSLVAAGLFTLSRRESSHLAVMLVPAGVLLIPDLLLFAAGFLQPSRLARIEPQSGSSANGATPVML